MLNTWLYIVVSYVLLNDILALLVATFHFLQYMYDETFIDRVLWTSSYKNI